MKYLLIALVIAMLLFIFFFDVESATTEDSTEALPTEVISAIEAEVAEEHGIDADCVMLLDARHMREDYYLVELLAQGEEYSLLTYVMRFDPDEGAEVNISDWQVKGGE